MKSLDSPVRVKREPCGKGTSQMIRFLGLSPKEAVPHTAPPMSAPYNWRCELGTSWRDIEDAGSVVKAIRLRSSAVSPHGRSGDAGGRGEGQNTPKMTRWTNFRSLCFSIL